MKEWPRELRRIGCELRRMAVDRFSGDWRAMAVRENVRSEAASFPVRLSMEQPMPVTDYVQAKVHNIDLARKKLENLPVPPLGILSFWRIVGCPTRARGFQRGRSLLGGRLRADYGGGLCQLSGVLYHLSLQAGLEVLERHPHSRDLYDDHTRYAPLGADATVAYAFKDLRVRNNLAVPICFRFSICDQTITGCLCSPASIEPSAVEFVRTSEADGTCTLETRRRRPGEGHFQVLSVSVYRRLE